ncbi:MAG: ABC transporter substrate-binding protein, partial [Myxococcota bacterium]|nr:ABC transporter substrate-binding protein [Myxococcota bacterium]
LGERVVGVSDYTDYPPEARLLPALGGVDGPHVEAILALQPELVFLVGEHPELRAALRSFGIRTESLRSDRLREVLSSITEIGEICAVPDAAAQLRQRIEQQLDALAVTETAPRPKVLLLVGRDPGAFRQLYAAGPSSYLGDVMAAVGLENALHTPEPWPLLGVESLVSGEIDAIIELRAEQLDSQGVALLLDEWQQQLPFVPAVQARRVRILASPAYTIPGPRLVELAGALARVRQELVDP